MLFCDCGRCDECVHLYTCINSSFSLSAVRTASWDMAVMMIAECLVLIFSIRSGTGTGKREEG